MQKLLLVFFGSGLGGAARFLFGTWASDTFRSGFPFATIAINTIGSFLIVVVMQLAARGAISEHVRLALTTGVLGGFTTYSAFNYETMYFLQHGNLRLGLMNHAVTVVMCLVAGGAGLLVVR